MTSSAVMSSREDFQTDFIPYPGKTMDKGSGILVVNAQGRIVTVNTTACILLGISREEILRQTYDEAIWARFRLPDDLMFSRVETNKPDEWCYTKIWKADLEMQPVRLSVLPLEEENTESSGLIFMIEDVPASRSMTDQVMRNERLSAMGEIYSNIAHEIRNPLGCISLFASALKIESCKNTLSELSDSILKNVDKINGILSNVKYLFSSETKPVFKKVEIHDHLNASLFFSKHGMAGDDDIRVKKQFCEECIHVRGDNELLKQMSMNILLNAVQAMAGTGELSITTSKKKDVSDGKTYVEICYKDTGGGIPAGELKKVFDPYFTTKRIGPGMGLSVVNNIVKLHGGTVHVRNRPVKGTAVVVVLPVDEGEDKRCMA